MDGPGFDADKFLAFPNSSINIYGEKSLRFLGKRSGLSVEEQQAMEKHANESCSVENYLEDGHLDRLIDSCNLRKEIKEFIEEFMDKKLERRSPRRVLSI